MNNNLKMFLCVSGIGVLLPLEVAKEVFEATDVLVSYSTDGAGVSVSTGSVVTTLSLDVVDHLLATDPSIHFYGQDDEVSIQPFIRSAYIERDSLVEAKGACKALQQG